MQANHFEIQKFDQKWIWLVLGIILIVMILGTIFIDMSFIIGIIISVPVILLLVLMRIVTVITSEGMSVRFFPIYMSEKKIKWEEVDNIYVRTFKPIEEFGGWGIRISYKNGLAFTTKGKYGIQVVFKNGKKFLLGTQKPHEAQEIIAKYFPLKTTFIDE